MGKHAKQRLRVRRRPSSWLLVFSALLTALVVAIAPTPVAAAHCAAITLSTGDPNTTDGALSMQVDPMGEFGGPLFTAGAIFNPEGPAGPAGTVQDSFVYLNEIFNVYDNALNCSLLEAAGATVTIDPATATSVHSNATISNADRSLAIDLTQEVSSVSAPLGAELTQTYRITNLGDPPPDEGDTNNIVRLSLVRHLDSSLQFDGNGNDMAGDNTQPLFVFDSTSDPSATVPAVGIDGTAELSDGTTRSLHNRTIQPFNTGDEFAPDYPDVIQQNNGIPDDDNGDIGPADSDDDTPADNITDAAGDVTLNMQWGFSTQGGFLSQEIPLDPGESVTLTTTTRWGTGIPANLVDNFRPFAGSGDYMTSEDEAIALPLADDSFDIDSVPNPTPPPDSVDRDTITVTRIVTPPGRGTAIIDPGGQTVTYTPDPDFVGTDSFSYRIDDGNFTSDVDTVTIDVVAGEHPTDIELFSRGLDDEQLFFEATYPAISGDGRWAAFVTAEPLDPLDLSNDEFGEGAQVEDDLYIRDLANGTTSLLTRGEFQDEASDPREEAPTDGDSTRPSLSSDGRYLAFESTATNFNALSVDDAVPDIYVVDRDPDNDGTFDEPFDTDGEPVFTRLSREVLNGCQIEPIPCERFNEGHDPSLAADAVPGGVLRVAWEEDVENSSGDVLLTEVPLDADGRLLAPADLGDLQIIDPPDLGAPGQDEDSPSMSADGLHVAYNVHDFDVSDSVVYDVASGVVTNVGRVRDADDAPVAGGASMVEPAVSGDGRIVAYMLDTFEPADCVETGAACVDVPTQIWAIDRDPDENGVLFDAGAGDGEPFTTEIVSGLDDDPTTPGPGADGDNFAPTITPDGRYVAFISAAFNSHDGEDAQGGPCALQPDDPGSTAGIALSICDIVVVDRQASSGVLVSESVQRFVNDEGCSSPDNGSTIACEGNGDSGVHDEFFTTTVPVAIAPSISDNARTIAFESSAFDLVPFDQNRSIDAFVRNFAATLTAQDLDFGTVFADDTPTLTSTVEMVGDFGSIDPSGVTITGSDASEFALVSDGCEPVVLHANAPDTSCGLTFRYQPTDSGPDTATVEIASDGDDAPTVFTLTGTALPPGELECVPSPLDFRGVILGTGSRSATVTCTNTGDSPLAITEVTKSGANAADFTFAAGDCRARLVTDASCDIRVTFLPGAVGLRSANLSLEHTAQGDSGPTVVPLRGTGIARRGTLTFNPASLTFSDQPGGVTSAPQTVTVTNAGNVPVGVTGVALDGTNPSEFAIVASTCSGVTLAPDGVCTVSVTFRPQAPETRTAILRFDGTFDGAPQGLGITGTVRAPSVVANPGVGTGGQVIEVTGQSFPPGQVVTVAWADPLNELATTGFPEPSRTVTVAADGTFKLELPTFRKTRIGTRAALATVGVFKANAPFLVALPTAQPADFVIRS